MKPSEVYLRAAEIMATDGDDMFGCCYHIARVEGSIGRAGSYDSKVQKSLARIFRPHRDSVYWWELTKEGLNCRVLALLFMHQIAKESE